MTGDPLVSLGTYPIIRCVSERLLDTLQVDLLTIGDDEIQDVNGRFIDVVLQALGLTVENAEPDEARNCRK